MDEPISEEPEAEQSSETAEEPIEGDTANNLSSETAEAEEVKEDTTDIPVDQNSDEEVL